MTQAFYAALNRAHRRAPAEKLPRLVDRWGECFKEWLHRLDGQYYRSSYAYANDYYRTTIVPLLQEIAATPAQTEAEFEAKLRILVEDDICTVLWHACQVRGSEYCRDITANQPEPMSKNPNPSHRKIRWATEG